MHLHDYKEEEVQACWFSDAEMKDIRNSIRNSILLMSDPNTTIDDICFDGLEKFTREETAARRNRREASVHAVLQEQEMQWENDEYDEELIAEAYQEFTILCRNIARMLAIENAKSVQKVNTPPFGSPTILSRTMYRSGCITLEGHHSSKRILSIDRLIDTL